MLLLTGRVLEVIGNVATTRVRLRGPSRRLNASIRGLLHIFRFVTQRTLFSGVPRRALLCVAAAPAFSADGKGGEVTPLKLASAGTDKISGWMLTVSRYESTWNHPVPAPGGNGHAMKRGPVILQLCILALCAAGMALSGEIRANTDVGIPVYAGVGSTSTAFAAGVAQDRTPETNAGTAYTRQNDISFTHPACGQDITDDDYANTLPAGRSCGSASSSRQPFSIQLGRRIGSRDEILGEFDGVRVDYRLADGLMLNGIAGYPVLSAEDVFNPSRQVFGISAATDHTADTWELNGYLTERQENGRVFDRSMGGAVRYLQPGRSILFYLDYDPVNQSVGALMASGALKLPRRTTFSATLDRQQRMIPELQKKYLTQSMTVMDGWDWILPDDRLAAHTAGGSSDVSIVALDLSYALSRRIRLRGDVVRLDVTDNAVAAGGTETSEYHYHFKISGKDLMMPGDSNRLDLRHSVTDAGRSYTATFNSRYAVRRFWNFVSQVRADYHRSEDSGAEVWEASPKVKMEYRPNRQYGFHIEAGGSVAEGGRVSENVGHPTYFVSLGYQADF